MNKRHIWSLCVVILFAIILSISKVAKPVTTEALSVQVELGQTEPHVVARTPLEGQRLDLSSPIQITFDRGMDPVKTGEAWSLFDQNNQTVPGKITWLDAKTFGFEADSKLNPSSVYQGIFSTTAAAQDGSSPKENIELEFMSADSLQVGQVFPSADTDDIDGTTSVTVIFNHPIVPITINEEQAGLPQPLEFSPQVTGQGQWVNSSVYVFQPEKALLSGIRYTVRVGAGLKDISGNTLDKSFVWQFTTRAPTVGSFALKNGQENPPLDNIQNVLLDQAFVVTFLQPMDAASVAKALSLVNRETGQAQHPNLAWNKDFTILTIQPAGRYKLSSFYDLKITSAAQASDKGPLKDGLTVSFSTVPSPQIAKMTPPNTEKGFDNSFVIQFASPMKLDSLKNKIIVTPAPKAALQAYYNDYDWSYTLVGLEPGTGYVVRILPGMSDIYGNTIHGESSYSFTTADMLPTARLVVPWTPLVYRAHGPQELYFEGTNLDSASLSLYSLSFEQFSSLMNSKSEDKGGGTGLTEFKPGQQPVRVWTPLTVSNRNQVNRLHFALEDPKGNPLSPGYYFIGVQGKPLDYTSNFYQGAIFIVATDNLTFKATSSEGLAWVVDLESGKPQGNVAVTFYDKGFTVVGKSSSDSNGLAYLRDINAPVYARAEGSNHLAFASISWGSGVWAGDMGISENYYANTSAPFIYLYSDRPVYRPGQDVYFKGLVRQNDDLHYSLVKESQIYLTIDQSGEQVYAKYLPISQLGGITDSFKLADDAALGTYTISARTSPAEDPFGYLTFRVAEYHKPQFQVNVTSGLPDILVGDKANINLDAAYYSGGTVAGAKVDWFMDAAPYSFSPSVKYSGFSFTDWDRDQYYSSPQAAGQGGTLAEGQNATDSNGHLQLTRMIDLGENKTDQQVTFNANVTDVAGDTVSGQTNIVLHQTQIYGGIRSLSYVGKQGEQQPFEVVVLDWNSNPVKDQRVTVKFVERKWFSVQKQDSQGQLSWETSVKDIPIGQKSAMTGEDGKAALAFVPPEGGVYKAIVIIRDSKGHSQQASANTWVSSEQFIAWRQTNDRTFNLIADKDTYSPGETAEFLIAQPFEGAVYALVTYERGHIYKQDVVLLTGNSTVYKLLITSDMAPMVYVSVVVVSGADQTKSPNFKIGMALITVDTSLQTLDVKVTADKKSAGPGDNVTYTILTQDSRGKPVSADVSLSVVDKAALALAPANSDPILKSFYPEQGLGVQTALGLVSNAEDFNAQYRQSIPEGGGSGGGGGDNSLGIITVRQDFKDTAFFQAQAITDASGQVQITVKLPENLTTWVADVRAATVDAHVGQASNQLVSTKNLFVELQTPRFFVAGDQARIGAVIHNNGSQDLKVNVSLDMQGVKIITPVAQTVNVPAKNQAYVTWDLYVNPDAPRVDLTVQATSGPYTDSSKPALGTLSGQGIPVYTYSVVETVGSSGILRTADSLTEGVQVPTTSSYSGAQLLVDVSPSLAASMQDSLSYLTDYPYLCMEQTISSFLPNVVSRRALKLAGLSNPSLQSNLDRQVSAALQRINAKQKPDGGWNWWDGNDSDPQTSAYVVLGLLEAKDAGYPVSADVLTNGMGYLGQNLPNLYQNAASWQYNRYAFMLYVLGRGQALQAGQTNFPYEHRVSLSRYGEAYLAQAMFMLDPQDTRITSLMSDLGINAVQSASGAHWQELPGDNDYWNWNTDTRTTAIVLNAFIQIDPQNPLTANAVRWLMAHRQAGHWQSTQETAWSLMALTNWLTASKEFETNYDYAVGLNGNLIKQGSAAKDNLTKSVKLQIDMKDLLKDAVNYLVFTRGSGTGNLYYDAYLSTTLPVESIAPLDQGMSLARQYFTLDDPKKPITEIRRGDLVRVRLTMVVSSDLHYIVIDDPLPAGLEAVDASITTDMTVPPKYTLLDYTERGWGWWYFDHTELRDQKVVLSADYLSAGTYIYSYLARASSVGTFKVIPPNASEFYFPDVGGRGAGSVFTIKP